MIKTFDKEIDPNESIFGRGDYTNLCKFMGWYPYGEIHRIKNIKIKIELEIDGE